MDTTQDARFAAEFHADVTVEKIAEVYAEAYLNAAKDQNVPLEDAVEEIESFVDVLKAQPKFAGIVASAMVSADEKLKLLEKALVGQASPIFWNFLKITAKRNRLDILGAIAIECRVRLDEIRGRIPVTITTAAELDDALLGTLSEKLRNILGGDPIIRSVVDPETLGGLVVRVGDTIYDASILTQLKNVRQQMIDRSANEIQRRRDSFRNPEGN